MRLLTIFLWPPVSPSFLPGPTIHMVRIQCFAQGQWLQFPPLTQDPREVKWNKRDSALKSPPGPLKRPDTGSRLHESCMNHKSVLNPQEFLHHPHCTPFTLAACGAFACFILPGWSSHARVSRSLHFNGFTMLFQYLCLHSAVLLSTCYLCSVRVTCIFQLSSTAYYSYLAFGSLENSLCFLMCRTGWARLLSILV